MDYSPPDSSVHGVFQAKIQEWVTMPSSRRSFWPMGWIWVSCIAGRFFTVWATRETFSSVQFSCSVMSNSLRPYGLQHPALSITNSWNLLKLMSIESVMPSKHLILCRPLFLLPSMTDPWKLKNNKIYCQSSKELQQDRELYKHVIDIKNGDREEEHLQPHCNREFCSPWFQISLL